FGALSWAWTGLRSPRLVSARTTTMTKSKLLRIVFFSPHYSVNDVGKTDDATTAEDDNLPPSLFGLRRLNEPGTRIVIIPRLRFVLIDVPYTWRAVIERVIQRSERMAAPSPRQPFHRDGAV